MKFVIAAPPYRNGSAGVRVLHRLCHLLNELGEDATLTTNVRNPQWNTKLTTQIGPETVVVYPETVLGNPLSASRVVRYYALSRAGAASNDRAYPSSDLVVYLDDWLREPASLSAGKMLPVAHRLFVSVLEPHIFFPRKAMRFIDCVHVGKARERAIRFPQHAPLWRYRIRDGHPSTRAGLAALLGRTRTLYAYDQGSALPFEASICGAQVRIVTENGGLEPSSPWETHALVNDWWNQGPQNVRQFVELVRERWQPAPLRGTTDTGN